MKAPRIPYRSQKTEKKIVEFKGLNVTGTATDGELKDAIGISTSDYPSITQRKGRTATDIQADDIFEWDNKLIAVTDGSIYYDGEALCACLPGKKQFAVVNTKLCVFPDGLEIDLNEHTVKHMSEKVTNKGDAAWTATTLQMSTAAGEYARTTQAYWYNPDPDGLWGWELTCDSFAYDEDTGWTLTNPRAVACGHEEGTHILFPERVTYNAESGTYAFAVPEIVWSRSIPSYTEFATYHNMMEDPEFNKGFYIQATIKESGGGTGSPDYWFSYRWLLQRNPVLSNVFQVGEVVSISGTEKGLLNATNLSIASIDDTTNTITFDGSTPLGVMQSGVFPTYSRKITSANAHNNVYYCCVGSNYYYRFTKVNLVGEVWLIFSEARESITKAYLYNEETQTMEMVSVSESSESQWIRIDERFYVDGPTYDFNSFAIARTYPELDYVCESNNRLWGVSNKDKTIYASALGNPKDMYGSSASPDGAYSVAVGSEGKFTAIYSYGNAVLCFKENKIHKILGSSPTDYYMNTYTMAGVQDGCERSLAVANEVLYYKGPFGVYAYMGGTPTLISYKLGEKRTTEAVGGTDTLKYYLSVKDGENYILYAYDITRGLWMKEDELHIEAFAPIENTLYALTGGEIIVFNKGDERFRWYAEFTPFIEAEFSKSGYTKLLLRLDMEKGAWLKVWVAEDRKPYRCVYTKSSSNDVTISVPLKLGRCDRFSLKFEGEGRTTIRSLSREFTQGSEV